MIGLSGITVPDAGITFPSTSTACGGPVPAGSCAESFELGAAVFELAAAFELAVMFELEAAFELAAVFELAPVLDSWVNEAVGDALLHANVIAREPSATIRISSFNLILSPLNQT